MSMDYIRRAYDVPARRGARLLFIGGGPDPESDDKVKTLAGTIVGSRGQYLRVRMDGEASIRTLHPTWRVEYLKTPNVRVKRAAPAGRQARFGDNVPRTAEPGLVACRWRSA